MAQIFKPFMCDIGLFIPTIFNNKSIGKDIRKEADIICLPVYMAGLL